jgi:hypothetical protein
MAPFTADPIAEKFLAISVGFAKRISQMLRRGRIAIRKKGG